MTARTPLGTHRVRFTLTFSIWFLPLDLSQAKIVLKGKSEEELLELEAIAKSLNLCARSIQDALVRYLA